MRLIIGINGKESKYKRNLYFYRIFHSSFVLSKEDCIVSLIVSEVIVKMKDSYTKSMRKLTRGFEGFIYFAINLKSLKLELS